MTRSSIGVAVIGAGMAGRAHASGYRTATTLYGEGLPEVDLVAVADVNEAFANDTARRFGFTRAETNWQAIAQASDIDVVSVVVANTLHREIVESLLAAGKHVLCEKPMAPSVQDAEAMVASANAADSESAIGFVFRRSPAITAIRDIVQTGGLGEVLHFNGRYWCDYGVDNGADDAGQLPRGTQPDRGQVHCPTSAVTYSTSPNTCADRSHRFAGRCCRHSSPSVPSLWERPWGTPQRR